jgi:ligand-binding sensor protein
LELLDIIKLEDLQKMQDMFALATGMASITVDMDGKFITNPSNFTDFCMKYTRKSEKGGERCARCSREGKGAYFCHAGLMDFAEPIMINGIQYGNAIGGQVLAGEPDIEKFKETARELGIPEDEYIEALRKVPIRSEASIRAAAELMKQLVNALVNLRYAMQKNEMKIAVLEQEIKTISDRTKSITSKAKNLEGISKKQSILSLNAAIEAGRAGNSGQGFQVVADQMGVLAKTSDKIYEVIIEDANVIYKSVQSVEETFKE